MSVKLWKFHPLGKLCNGENFYFHSIFLPLYLNKISLGGCACHLSLCNSKQSLALLSPNCPILQDDPPSSVSSAGWTGPAVSAFPPHPVLQPPHHLGVTPLGFLHDVHACLVSRSQGGPQCSKFKVLSTEYVGIITFPNLLSICFMQQPNVWGWVARRSWR